MLAKENIDQDATGLFYIQRHRMPLDCCVRILLHIFTPRDFLTDLLWLIFMLPSARFKLTFLLWLIILKSKMGTPPHTPLLRKYAYIRVLFQG